MDLEKLQNRYQNLLRDDLERMQRLGYCENSMKKLNGQREKMRIRGREHVASMPLVQVLSVHVVLDENKPLAIYGRIYGEYDDSVGGNETSTRNVYNRGCDEPEIIIQNGNLTLTEPRESSCEFDVCMPLHKTTSIAVDLWDADQKVAFAQGSFMVEEIAENEYEQVKTKVVLGMSGYVVVRYIAMPFGSIWQVVIRFFHKGYKKEGNCYVVNVNGKIAVRYDNTYGNYSSEEYTIFEKSSFEFEPLEVNSRRSLRQSRCWIGVPSYSSIVVDFDLWDFNTKHNFLKATAKFPTQQPWYVGYHHSLTADDLTIDMHVTNLHLFPPQVCKEENNRGSLSDSCIPWIVRTHGTKLIPSGLVEFYSVFIGHEKRKPLRIFGVIEASCGGHTFDIFRRQESDAIELLEDETSLPILDGKRRYSYDHSFKIMVDLKDVDGSLSIKGFVKWRKDQLDEDLWFDEQLRSVIPGEHGFAAMHYTLFSFALEANIEVFYKINNSCSNVSPLIYGSLVAHCNYWGHLSLYTRDYYRIVLFQRNQDDPVHLSCDKKLPLSRSLVVVPVQPGKPTLNIQLSLWSVGLNKCLSHIFEIEIGCRSISIEKDGVSVDIKLNWSNGTYMSTT